MNPSKDYPFAITFEQDNLRVSMRGSSVELPEADVIRTIISSIQWFDQDEDEALLKFAHALLSVTGVDEAEVIVELDSDLTYKYFARKDMANTPLRPDKIISTASLG